ncbi:acyl-CoA desaturase-like [Corticium candelabrum]|uniref:acyl-CoA desaturase-like n=1 Tax=Corticium candelabrum TaxID=121492 RepID=UPI002E26D06B|nr:acyl-CoA desaturase-like [Corticium candelabrum]XP_062510140.1 acyl-CoA desaturase-like [Corticium candelabrum]
MTVQERPAAPEESAKRDESAATQLVWKNVAILSFIHLSAFYGLYLLLTRKCMLWTAIYLWVPYTIAGLGITAGVHRLWSHRAYKASFGLRVFLMIANCMAMQTSIYEWSRDHRTHHKFSDTNADPYNSQRGFWFSHMGWVVRRKHPDVVRKGRGVDTSDLEADCVVTFQRKYYVVLALFFGMFVPSVIPLLWNESLAYSFLITMFRYAASLHQTWLVNSAAHMFGYRPYDKNIRPRENVFVSWVTIGEGFHNYHHTFPQDYRASEYGFSLLSFTTMFIDCCSWLGLATACKPARKEMIKQRRMRTGEHD